MQRACKLNVSVIDKPDQWTPEEIQILKDNYLTMGKDVYKLLPGRTSTTCAAKANSIGISFFINKDWTPEEDKILMDNYRTMGKKICNLLLKRSYKACISRFHVLNKK